MVAQRNPAFQIFGLPGNQPDPESVIVMLIHSKSRVRKDRDAHLLHQLSAQASRRIFAVLQLAAGKFPQSGLGFTLPPPGDQDSSFFIMYNRSCYFNHGASLL
ncbi:hypothetical protein D3C75_1015120 [compost metagenome]